jgi:hypothetical protein
VLVVLAITTVTSLRASRGLPSAGETGQTALGARPNGSAEHG